MEARDIVVTVTSPNLTYCSAEINDRFAESAVVVLRRDKGVRGIPPASAQERSLNRTRVAIMDKNSARAMQPQRLVHNDRTVR